MFLESHRADPRFLLILVIGAAATFSCTTEPAPPPPPLDVAGTWGGPASQTGASGVVAFPLVVQLTQNGETVAGTYVSNVFGTISATLSGGTLSGSATASYGNCTLATTFTAQVSGSTMAGTYSGADSCAGLITNGQFSLTNQTGQAVDLSGVWNGVGGERGNGRTLAFQLGGNGSGTFVATDNATGIATSGTVTATVSGSTLIGTLRGSYASCDVTVTFAALVAVAPAFPMGMTGAYSGTNTCIGP